MKPYNFTPGLNNVKQARWRCLLKRLDNKVENVSNVIITCFALNNFCQINGETHRDHDGILEDLV